MSQLDGILPAAELVLTAEEVNAPRRRLHPAFTAVRALAGDSACPKRRSWPPQNRKFRNFPFISLINISVDYGGSPATLLLRHQQTPTTVVTQLWEDAL